LRDFDRLLQQEFELSRDSFASLRFDQLQLRNNKTNQTNTTRMSGSLLHDGGRGDGDGDGASASQTVTPAASPAMVRAAAANVGVRGAAGLDELLESMTDKLPFAIDKGAALAYVPVPSESIMTDEECKEVWTELFGQWKVQDASKRTKLMNAVLLYLVENGSSPRGQYKKDLVIGGDRYAMSKFKLIVGGEVRRFARAHADYVRAMMSTVNCKAFANRQAVLYGLSDSYRHLAFDFADACTNLSLDEISKIAATKAAVLSGKEYATARPEIAKELSGTESGENVIGADSQLGGARNHMRHGN